VTRARERVIAVAVVVVVIVIVVANLLARALDDAVGGSEPGGAPGSSYATASDGLAAYAQLLARYGHAVERQRGSLAGNTIDPEAVLVLSASDRAVPLDDDELATIRAFLDAGGRAVVAGLDPRDVEAITGVDLATRTGRRAYHEFAAQLSGLRTVTSGGEVAYMPDGAATVLAHQGDAALLVTVPVNGGEALVLADATPLTNDAIGEADNAAFGLALPGGDRPVVFAEGVHGYGEHRGLAALPDRWKAALAALGGSAILFAWARARRLGPPDRPARELPPARSAYVDALAATLARTSDHERSVAPLGDWARDQVRRRAGLDVDAARTEVDAAARAMGLDDAQIATLWHPPRSDEELLVLGSVVARVADERT
jgi:hypothetical protein